MQEDLPNIYDDRNHLEVTEYVDDIYQYYWVMEVIFDLFSSCSRNSTCWCDFLQKLLIHSKYEYMHNVEEFYFFQSHLSFWFNILKIGF